jgi:hypothetical protein
MRYLVIGCLVCVCLASCGPNPQPQMPKFQTEQGKVNARACLQTYNNCTLPCYAIGSNSCVHRCNDSLANCYATAE